MKKKLLGKFTILTTVFIGSVLSMSASGQDIFPIVTVNAPCHDAGYPASNVLDGNSQTWFKVNPFGSGCSNMELNMHLSKTVKALQVTITAGIAGISISPGSTLNYHTTLENSETLYIIKPDGFSTIQFYRQGWGSISEIEIVELDLESISLPFDYDDAGNMIQRTILLGSVKGSMAGEAPPSGWDGSEDEQPDNQQMLSFGDIVIYPNPTKGELHIETSFDDNALSDGLLTVYSMNGTQIIKKPFNTSTATISISDQPPGVYILTLTVNGEVQRWNIIKQ